MRPMAYLVGVPGQRRHQHLNALSSSTGKWNIADVIYVKMAPSRRPRRVR